MSGALHSRLDISLLWNIRRIPLLMKLFGGDQTIPMAGRLVREGPKRSVIRSATPSTRFCVLWDFVKLKNIVAFVECEETVSIYGVDCVAEIEVANGTGGRATLSFEGRLCATIAESAQSLYSNTDAVHGALVRPADLVIEGTLADNAWNCVAGVPFVHLLQPTLRFVVNATTHLPLPIAVHGTPVVQSADPWRRVQATMVFSGPLVVGWSNSLSTRCRTMFCVCQYPHLRQSLWIPYSNTVQKS